MIFICNFSCTRNIKRISEFISCDTMTIIHNESNIKFEMIPSYHINSQTGIPDDIAYKILCPYEKFIEEAVIFLNQRKPRIKKYHTVPIRMDIW